MATICPCLQYLEFNDFYYRKSSSKKTLYKHTVPSVAEDGPQVNIEEVDDGSDQDGDATSGGYQTDSESSDDDEEIEEMEEEAEGEKEEEKEEEMEEKEEEAQPESEEVETVFDNKPKDQDLDGKYHLLRPAVAEHCSMLCLDQGI